MTDLNEMGRLACKAKYELQALTTEQKNTLKAYVKKMLYCQSKMPEKPIQLRYQTLNMWKV